MWVPGPRPADGSPGGPTPRRTASSTPCTPMPSPAARRPTSATTATTAPRAWCCVGGCYGQYQDRGAFFLVGNGTASGASADIGCRLQKLPSRGGGAGGRGPQPPPLASHQTIKFGAIPPVVRVFPAGVPVLRRLLQLQRLGRGVARRRQLQPEPEPRRFLPERQQHRLEREREHRLPSPCQVSIPPYFGSDRSHGLI